MEDPMPQPKKSPKPATPTEGPITPDLVSELDAQRADVAAALAQLQDYTIDTHADLAMVSGILQDVVTRKDALQLKRDAIVKPISEGLANVRALFKGPIEALQAAEEMLKAKIDAGERALREQNAKVIAATSTAVQLGNEQAAAALASQIEPTHMPAGVSFREVWDFEITDPAALPREFLVPDEKLIRSAVSSLKDQTTIPGVRVFSRRVVAASRVA
jgi:hypothetical protein